VVSGTRDEQRCGFSVNQLNLDALRLFLKSEILFQHFPMNRTHRMALLSIIFPPLLLSTSRLLHRHQPDLSCILSLT
jgi:hypothetical protein